MTTRAIVFVHGAFHGPWCWDEIVARMESPDVVCRCVELYRGGLAEDAGVVRGEIDSLAEDGCSVVVVGHSLGCVSLSHLAPEGIAHAVFLAGPVAGPGLPDVQEAVEADFSTSMNTGTDGTISIDAALAREIFYHDCDPEMADWAIGKLRPNLAYGPLPRPGPPLYETVPSTYLWCEHDRAVLPKYQREIARKMRYSEGFATGHSPMLAAPDELSAALGRVLERTPARE